MVFEKCDGSGSIRLGLCGPDRRICVFFSVWVIWACDLWDLAELWGFWDPLGGGFVIYWKWNQIRWRVCVK